MKGIDLANYIVEKQIGIGEPTNTLSLQKVIYFVNAEYMKHTKKPDLLIEDDFEKWKFGPVVPDVYHEYSYFGSLPITNIPFTQLFDWDEDNFVQEVKNEGISIEKLNEWIDKYINEPRFKLVEATHKHSSWKNYEDQINQGEKGLKYTAEELYNEIKDDNEFFKV